MTKKIRTSCIIDDDPILIYGTKRLMKEVDFCENILVYNNGQDAIDRLTEVSEVGDELPEVIFLDLNMPIMNGWEFLDEFVKLQNSSPDKVTVYIISSSIDPRDLERVKNYDVVHSYILKPMTDKDLKGVLATYNDH